MSIIALNTDFDAVAVVEHFNSIIWTDRFRECGDFELQGAMDSGLLSYIKRGYYLKNSNSDRMMVIEQIQIDTDEEEGDTITVSGRSLESILDRRIVWGQKTVNGNLQDVIETLLNENVINPSDTNRKIDDFVFERSEDPVITSISIEAQYDGDDLYSIIASICSEYNVGFKIVLNNQNEFVFSLYSGEDRSYHQIYNPQVIFSPNFENIINSRYLRDNTGYKNVTLVGGEGEGDKRKYATCGNSTGLNRREIFTDARSVSSSSDNRKLSDEEYTALLQQKGRETLSDSADVTAFEGQVATEITFRYGVDYKIGDIVTVRNKYKIEATAQITEVIESVDESGHTIVPTFEYTYSEAVLLTEDFQDLLTEAGEQLLAENGYSL